MGVRPARLGFSQRPQVNLAHEAARALDWTMASTGVGQHLSGLKHFRTRPLGYAREKSVATLSRADHTDADAVLPEIFRPCSRKDRGHPIWRRNRLPPPAKGVFFSGQGN